MLRNLNDDEFQTEAREKTDPIVILFTGSFCVPCKRFKPIVEEISQAIPDVRFAEMDIEECERTTSFLGIRAVPTLVLFNDGMLREIHSGTMTKSDLRLWIHENI